jgi:hypothetical protein
MELVVEKTSTADLMEEADRLGRAISATLGALMAVVGELDRREAWRAEGATSSGAWLTQRLGVAEGTGRSWSQVAEKLWDMPHIGQGLRVGALSFDKVRVAVELATPESDASVLRQAEECTVRQLTDLVRANRGTNDERAADRFENRYLRFNDARRMITAQLAEDAYAEVRAAVSDRARLFPSDGETRYDQRRADALVDICRGARGTMPATGNGDSRVGAGAESGGKKRRQRRQRQRRQRRASALPDRHPHLIRTSSWSSTPISRSYRADPVGLRSSGWDCSVEKPCGGSVAMVR